VSIDSEKPVIVNAALKDAMDEHNAEWQKNVLQAVSIQTVYAKVKTKAEHTLTITMIDPGVVLDKFMICFNESCD